jgi:hypothetical protein
MAKTPNDMVVGMITVKNSKDGYWNTALQPSKLDPFKKAIFCDLEVDL